MTQFQTIASVNIGGVYTPLTQGFTTIGELKCTLHPENKAENLYSWIVYLENTSDRPSPRIRELLGLDLLLPVTGNTQLNTLRGDDCTVYSFYPESFSLEDGDTLSRRPTGGRSSNTTAFSLLRCGISPGGGSGGFCGNTSQNPSGQHLSPHPHG